MTRSLSISGTAYPRFGLAPVRRSGKRGTSAALVQEASRCPGAREAIRVKTDAEAFGPGRQEEGAAGNFVRGTSNACVFTHSRVQRLLQHCMEPVPHGNAAETASRRYPPTSRAWRCAACGRLNLFGGFIERPRACMDCTSSALYDAGPSAAADGSQPAH